jgi:hypothetical protein
MLCVRVVLCQSSNKWLVIAASESQLVPVIDRTRDLQKSWPEATVVASNDCVGLRPGLYLAVAMIAASRSEAEAAVSKLRAEVPDGYVRECSPKANTTLAFGIPLVDKSIWDVPSNAVNWSDSDRLSSVHRLPVRGYLWIRRKYVPGNNDPLEGRVASVIYFDKQPQNGVELDSNCIDPGDKQSGTLVALECAREVAADNLLHETIVFDLPAGTRVKSIQHCRNPSFISTTELTCKEEHVDAQGKLELVSKRVSVR